MPIPLAYQRHEGQRLLVDKRIQLALEVVARRWFRRHALPTHATDCIHRGIDQRDYPKIPTADSLEDLKVRFDTSSPSPVRRPCAVTAKEYYL